MSLGEFKDYILSFPERTIFPYTISEPFSWRGIYAEVAFSVEVEEESREEILNKIETALTETFYGYKGGEYKYNEDTEIHFERQPKSWSDGEYAAQMISEILGEDNMQDPEERLVKLMFN